MTLSEYRRWRGLSLRALAEFLSLSAPTVHRYEVGSRTPSLSTAARIMELTEGRVRPEDFIASDKAA